jgi:hypothetical protein
MVGKISEKQAKRLGETINWCLNFYDEKEGRQASSGGFRVVCREEAARLILKLSDYDFDNVKRKVFTEKGNTRTYVS